jgi:SSS family solute:Na+ symporter
MLGWFFLPFYMRSGAFTMPEFLEKRFDSRSRWFLSVFSIAGYVLTKVSVTIYAGGIVVSKLLDIPFLYGAIVTVLVTGIYTILGGMRAVVYTEAVQTVLILLGSAIITYLGLQRIGGWDELRATVGNEHFNMWRPSSDPDFPWTGLMFGGAVVGIWYWCTDQYIVQRTLAANNIRIGRRGAIFGAYLKLAPIFIFLIPGIIAYGLKLKGMINYDRSDEVFPTLVQTLLPVGLKGLVAAGLLAALMSSLASVFNSASTLFTVDIFKKLYPDSPEKKLVQIGKIATGIIVVLGMLWIPIMDKIGGGVLYQYLQNVQAYIAPPITAVFILGILWKGMTSTSAIVTLSYGLVSATIRIVFELFKENLDGLPLWYASVNFSHFAIINCLVCLIVALGVSLFTQKTEESRLSGLTLGTLTAEQRKANRESFTWGDVLISMILLSIVISVLVYFRG